MMMTRIFALTALFALSGIAQAQSTTPAAPAASPPSVAPATTPAPAPRLHYVTLTVPQGEIVIALEVERAPVSAANFLRYVDARRFDGIPFYRAMNMGQGNGLIQGGIRVGGRSFAPIAHETTTQTGLSHTDGAISWARLTPGTATSDFFIISGNMTGLDAQPTAAGDNAGFAVFGHVVRGMDIVRGILNAPTDPNIGPAVMRGQMLANPVLIRTARRSAVLPPETTAPATQEAQPATPQRP